MRKILLSIIILCISFNALYSQLGFVHNGHSLEVTGLVTATFTNRDNVNNTKKYLNFFDPRNAQLRLEYNYKIVRCVVQADIASLTLGNFDPENIGLMDLWFQLKPVGALKIRAGFFKVRYSRSNLVSEYDSPFFNRSEICRGQIFGSRDFGLNVNYAFFRGLLNINVGTYTGLAETSLKGKNDLNNKYEYVARVDFAWPQKDKGTDFDLYHKRLPEFTLGANVRYNAKDATISDTYQLLVVGGKKIIHGYDAGFFYKGLAFTGEINMFRVAPLVGTRLYGNKGNHFNGYGYYAQASYYLHKIDVYGAIRYDKIDQNQFFTGFGDRITAAIGSYFLHNHMQVKLNYTHIINTEDISTYNGPSWQNQWRIGVYYSL